MKKDNQSPDSVHLLHLRLLNQLEGATVSPSGSRRLSIRINQLGKARIARSRRPPLHGYMLHLRRRVIWKIPSRGRH